MIEDALQKKFKHFVKRLLSAQKYDFSKEHNLFSTNTLRKILNEFCDIIAEELQVESCTIHLRVYDPDIIDGKNSAVFQLFLKRKLRDISEAFRIAEKNLETSTDKPEAILIEDILKNISDKNEKRKLERRIAIWQSNITFPHWQYPKGAMKLFAATEDDPWRKLNLESSIATEQENLIANLHAGITKQIYQENIAKIRDRMSMRESRFFRKLGGRDTFIWDNRTEDERRQENEGGEVKNYSDILTFRNYFGAPIRIHSEGEVIGVLKVENKKYSTSFNLKENGEQKWNEFIRDLDISNGADWENSIYEQLKSLYSDFWDISLLSLIYLINDIKLHNKDLNPGKRTILHFISGKYTDYFKGENDPDFISSDYSSYILPHEEPPPIQIMTDSLRTEKLFWLLLQNVRNKGKLSDIVQDFKDKKKFDKWIMELNGTKIKKVFDKLNRFYEDLLNRRKRIGKQGDIEQEIAFAFNKTTGFANLTIICEKKNYFDFIYEGKIKIKGEAEAVMSLFFLIPPSIDEIKNFEAEKKERYIRVNRYWSKGLRGETYREKDILLNYFLGNKANGEFEQFRYLGELVTTTVNNEYFATDLLYDRIAARVQSYVYSTFVPQFLQEDAHKLSWAALEIGKLIEREISYHANKGVEPIPLTALEFFRLPISDLSFVDGVRDRISKVRKIYKNVEHHLANLILYLKMENAIKSESRIKAPRSSFMRLGERQEGFIRGNLAIWFYLLSIKMQVLSKNSSFSENKNISEDILVTPDKFFKALCRFREKVECRIKLEKMSDINKKKKLEEMSQRAPYWIDPESKTPFDNFHKNVEEVIDQKCFCDLNFDAYPFTTENEEKYPPEKLILRILDNLNRENILSSSRNLNVFHQRKPGEIEFSLSKKTLYVKTIPDQEIKIKLRELENLLLRNYEEYPKAAYSLLCQLLNKAKSSNNSWQAFDQFYKTCWELRRWFSIPKKEIEENLDYKDLKEIFDEGKISESKQEGETSNRNEKKNQENIWETLLNYLDDRRTAGFFKRFFFQRIHLKLKVIFSLMRPEFIKDCVRFIKLKSNKSQFILLPGSWKDLTYSVGELIVCLKTRYLPYMNMSGTGVTRFFIIMSIRKMDFIRKKSN